MRRLIDLLRNPRLQLILLLALYSALLFPTITRQGISWDEQNDLWIAQSYLVKPDGWLVGSAIDASQTRLPMFVTALIYHMLGTSDLIAGRAVSCLVGMATLIGVYVFCKDKMDHRRALLGVGLLASSPFYLSFARVAFTETDIYLACAFAWLLVSVARLQERLLIGRAAMVGVILGLALSAKFTTLAIFPAVWYAVFQARKVTRAAEEVSEGMVLSIWINWIIAAVLMGLGYGVLASRETYTEQVRRIHYCLVLLAWAAPLAWAAWKRKRTASAGSLSGFITVIALLTFLIIPPDHLTNSEILRALEWRFFHEMPHPPAFILEAAALHLLSLVFKSGPLVGLGMLISLGVTLRHWQRQEIRFPLLLWLCYFTGLTLLPLAQTFYIVPLLPILAVFTSDQYLRLWDSRRLLASILGIMALAAWGMDMILCYPDYNLNGYQWLGERVIAGRSSIGYRSVIQTPSDGVQQAFEWLNANAKPGERVLAYLFPWHIVQATAPHPVYRIKSGFDGSLYSNPDYVVVDINAQVRQSWWSEVSKGEVFKPPYDAAWLEKHYTKVFSVMRRFDVEMVSVWHRK